MWKGDEDASFADGEGDGRADFWRVYDVHWDEITERVSRFFSGQTGFFRFFSERSLREARTQTYELARRACLEGDWSAYEENLRQRAVQYARARITFEDWYKLIALIRDVVSAGILEAYESDRARDERAR